MLLISKRYSSNKSKGSLVILSSELFKGIGKKTAEKIVDTLGENAISKIIK